MDENYGELTPSGFDIGLNQEKLSAFKSILKERHTIDYFINENDLASKLYINRCEEFKSVPPNKDWDGVYFATRK